MAVKLLDFWAPWCPPCKMMDPVIEELEKELSGKVKVAKVNVDEDPGMAQKYGVMSIPAYIIEKEGKEVARLSGAKPKGEFKRWVEEQL